MAKQFEMETLTALDPSLRMDIQLSRDLSNYLLSEKLWDALKADVFTVRLRQIAWESFRTRKLGTKGTADLTGRVDEFLKEHGLKEMVANITLRLFERNAAINMTKGKSDTSLCVSRTSKDESINFIRAARLAWEQGINEELLTVVKEAKKPFIIFRAAGKLCPYLDQENSPLGNQDEVRFLFDSEDLMETAMSIRDPTVKGFDRMFSVLMFELRTPTLDDLIRRYAEMSIVNVQLGVDDTVPRHGHRFCILRHDEGEVVIARCNPLEAREYLRGGSVPALRAKLWRVALGLTAGPNEQEDQLFSELRMDCDRLDMVTDELYLHDVQNVVDDPRFFPFEEELNTVVLCFIRDPAIRNSAMYEVHEPIIGGAAGQGVGSYAAFRVVKSSVNSSGSSSNATSTAGGDSLPVASPPSAVQPFLGFASYFAPLCYLYSHKPSLYAVTRSMWCKLWCKLNVLSGDEGTLLHMCKTFENLLATVHPRLFLQLLQLGLNPLHVAFPWMHVGFVGFLEVDQLLILWDRVIGYMDTTLFAVLACAVFVNRSELLFMPDMTAEKATLMLCEGSRLKVMPLLQMFLYCES